MNEKNITKIKILGEKKNIEFLDNLGKKIVKGDKVSILVEYAKNNFWLTSIKKTPDKAIINFIATSNCDLTADLLLKKSKVFNKYDRNNYYCIPSIFTIDENNLHKQRVTNVEDFPKVYQNYKILPYKLINNNCKSLKHAFAAIVPKEDIEGMVKIFFSELVFPTFLKDKNLDKLDLTNNEIDFNEPELLIDTEKNFSINPNHGLIPMKERRADRVYKILKDDKDLSINQACRIVADYKPGWSGGTWGRKKGLDYFGVTSIRNFFSRKYKVVTY